MSVTTSSLFHFVNGSRVTALEVHPQFAIVAMATTDGSLYVSHLPSTVSLHASSTTIANETSGTVLTPNQTVPPRLDVPASSEEGMKLPKLQLVAKFPNPPAQIAWASWVHGLVLACLVTNKNFSIYTAQLSAPSVSDELHPFGEWVEETTEMQPECHYIAFCPRGILLACACPGGRTVILQRSEERVWRQTAATNDDSETGPKRDVMKGPKRNTWCVAWADLQKPYLFASSEDNGSVRVHALVENGTAWSIVELLSFSLQIPLRLLAFAPVMARSFLLLAGATSTTLSVFSMSLPSETVGARVPAAAAPVVPLDRTFTLPQQSAPARRQLMSMWAYDTSKTYVAELTGLAWNAAGTSLVTTHADGSVHTFSISIRPQTSQGGGGIGNGQDITLQLLDDSSTLPPFYFNHHVVSV